MKNKIKTTQHSGEAVTNGVTVVRGKILEYIIEDAKLYQEDFSNAACACGSGGGCSGGYIRNGRTRSNRKH